ncbi:MAG TPA: hypothetical protein PLD79_01855 [Halothiobacillus sp.]|nr:hypothetical protein [Halothiobacillus sp.]
MTRSVLRFMFWPHPNLAARSPPESLEQLGELMTFYREQLVGFRPNNHSALRLTDPTRAAQIDGLIMALLLLDGLLTARSDALAGRPLRLPTAELTEYKVTPTHFTQQTVDFAWRRLCERYVRRSRDLLQAAAMLGRPWLSGMPYRLCIARTEQVLREIQVDPAGAYQGETRPKLMAKLTAAARIFWRTLTGRA